MKQDLATAVRGLKARAEHYVRAYARASAPNVPLETVDAFCQALGEISVDEALNALDRVQTELAGWARI